LDVNANDQIVVGTNDGHLKFWDWNDSNVFS